MYVCLYVCMCLAEQVLEENEIGFDALELLEKKDVLELGIKLGPAIRLLTGVPAFKARSQQVWLSG